jgi:class 3 adenylate cyclase
VAVVLPMVSEHGGRVIDTAGDGILAEFCSVVNAVECAIVMQKTISTSLCVLCLTFGDPTGKDRFRYTEEMVGTHQRAVASNVSSEKRHQSADTFWAVAVVGHC